MRDKSITFFKEKVTTKVALKVACDNCRKPNRDRGKKSSITSWLFREYWCCCSTGSGDKPGARITHKKISELSQPQLASKLDTYDIELTDDDRYEIISCIGKGGMGTVYEVRDKILDRRFALKVLRTELASDEGSVKRLEREAKTAMDLTHPNLGAVFGFGRVRNGLPYLVMELVQGETLTSILQKNVFLDVPSALDIFLQICDALQHAHMKGVLHRDLKPGNIMLTPRENGADLVKVVDFGIAKSLLHDGSKTNQLTQTGELLGSPLYMSPEQCHGADLDARSDVYSFGCVMYEALSGRPPFSGENPVRVILQHLNNRPARFNKSLDIPAVLEAVVFKCLDKDPAERYQSVDELHADLESCLNGTAPRFLRNPVKQKRSYKDLFRFVVHDKTVFFMAVLAMLTVQLCVLSPFSQSLQKKQLGAQVTTVPGENGIPELSYELGTNERQNIAIIEGLLGMRIDPAVRNLFSDVSWIKKRGNHYLLERGRPTPSLDRGATDERELALVSGSSLSFNVENNKLANCHGMWLTAWRAGQGANPINSIILPPSGDSQAEDARTIVINANGPIQKLTISLNHNDKLLKGTAVIRNPLSNIDPNRLATIPSKILVPFEKRHPNSSPLTINIIAAGNGSFKLPELLDPRDASMFRWAARIPEDEAESKFGEFFANIFLNAKRQDVGSDQYPSESENANSIMMR